MSQIVGLVKLVAPGNLALAIALGTAVSPGQAVAQDRPMETPDTLVEQTEPLGIRARGFLLYPRLTADLRHDTNVFNRADGDSDTIVVLKPGLSVRPDLARHALRFDVAGEVRRYFQHKRENSEQWLARGEGRLDLAERTALTGHVSIARRIENRGTLGDETTATSGPATYTEKEAALGIGRSGARLELGAELGVRKLDYRPLDDLGVRIDQRFRDMRQDWVSVRASLNRSQRLGLTLRGRYNRARYEINRQRNSDGFSLLAGVRYDLTDQLKAEVAGGYLQQNFDDPAERTFRGVDFSVAVAWTPTARLKAEASGGRRVERSPLPDASAVVQSRFDAGVSYALNSKVLVGFDAAVVRDDYRGISRRETRYFAEATARYRLHPRISAIAGAGWRKQDGRGLGSRDYHGALFRVGLNFTP